MRLSILMNIELYVLCRTVFKLSRIIGQTYDLRHLATKKTGNIALSYGVKSIFVS